MELAKTMERSKLLTLTMKNKPYLQREDIKLLRRQFNRLMRRKYYRKRIKGGLYVIQLKNIGNGWNLHIHALIDVVAGDMGYLSQQRISDNWLEITGDSMVVDVRKARNSKLGFRYIVRYLTTPPELDGQELLYNRVLKGTRLIQTFGDLYGSHPDKPKMPPCEVCGCNEWIIEFEIKGMFEDLRRSSEYKRTMSLKF